MLMGWSLIKHRDNLTVYFLTEQIIVAFMNPFHSLGVMFEGVPDASVKPVATTFYFEHYTNNISNTRHIFSEESSL
jgi:hypothetical protein